jgi:predicted aspartyl protease
MRYEEKSVEVVAVINLKAPLIGMRFLHLSIVPFNWNIAQVFEMT